MRGVQNGVGNDEARHWLATYDVGLNDFVHIFRLNASVPDGFGIDHHGGTQFTLVQASRFVGANILKASLSQLGFEKALQLALPGRIATTPRVPGLALIHANKNMFVEFGHNLV
jgi:hypothetical protein